MYRGQEQIVNQNKTKTSENVKTLENVEADDEEFYWMSWEEFYQGCFIMYPWLITNEVTEAQN